MRLTKLELHGFKSFADATHLLFEPGVTAIVGPNGCGKSNVSDAVRWVLGEQRARLMRGAKMDEVIFQGSSARRPVNVAEVSLHFSSKWLLRWKLFENRRNIEKLCSPSRPHANR